MTRHLEWVQCEGRITVRGVLVRCRRNMGHSGQHRSSDQLEGATGPYTVRWRQPPQRKEPDDARADGGAGADADDVLR